VRDPQELPSVVRVQACVCVIELDWHMPETHWNVVTLRDCVPLVAQVLA
jgi:hypothetical protein